MGFVFEAEQESMSRSVALKVLKPGMVDPKHLARFLRESRAPGRLHHTNIVPIFGIGESHGLHFYAMQFIHGESLDEVIDDLRWIRDHGGADAPRVDPGRDLTERPDRRIRPDRSVRAGEAQRRGPVPATDGPDAGARLDRAGPVVGGEPGGPRPDIAAVVLQERRPGRRAGGAPPVLRPSQRHPPPRRQAGEPAARPPGHGLGGRLRARLRDRRRGHLPRGRGRHSAVHPARAVQE